MASLHLRPRTLNRGLPFDLKLPNEETLRTFASTEKGEDLTACKDADDMFKRLEI
jgi:antitoxin component of RelBE/YafQ-DinJ toxin-antitoxin module